MITASGNYKALELAVDEAIYSIRIMSAKRRINLDEWRTFFLLDGDMEIISHPRFLRELGNCFISNGVNDDLYQFLMVQISRIDSYLRSRHINLTNGTGTDPLLYAKSKINMAYERRKENKLRFLKIAFIVMIIINRIFYYSI